MFLTVSCFLKPLLVISLLIRYFTDYAVDDGLILSLAVAVFTFDLYAFKNEKMKFTYFKPFMLINFMPLKKRIVVLNLVFFLIGSMAFFVSPLYSKENIALPDLSGLKPYTAGTNYMSFEGYIISYFKVNYAREISRGEARKIVKSILKKLKNNEKEALIQNDKAISRVNEVKEELSPEKFKLREENENKCREILNYLKSKDVKISVKNVEEPPAAPVKNAIASKADVMSGIIVEKPVKHEEFLKPEAVAAIKKSGAINIFGKNAKYNEKRIVLLPFKNSSGDGDAAENIFHCIERYFKERGYDVISGAGISGICFNLDYLDKDKLSEIAEKFDANFIITGKIGKYKKVKKGFPSEAEDSALFREDNFGELDFGTKVINATSGSSYKASDKICQKHRLSASFDGGGRGVWASEIKGAVERLYSKFMF